MGHSNVDRNVDGGGVWIYYNDKRFINTISMTFKAFLLLAGLYENNDNYPDHHLVPLF